MKDNDITIVGGGMIGLATAALFVREGFQVLLLDAGPPAHWDAASVEGRVSAISPSTRNLLDHVGVWRAIAERRVSPYTAMRVRDSHSAARIAFDAADEGVAALGHIVENALIATCLTERLGHNYNVTLRHDVRVTGFDGDDNGQATLTLENGETVHSTLVVAADGAQSALRALAGIPMDAQDFRQDAITATLECERHHGGAALQVFTPEGPIAMLPLSDNRCSLVWSRDREQDEDLLALDAGEFCSRLEMHFSDQLGGLRLLGDRLRFPLGSRHAAVYTGTRLALVGDAAHTVHPLAGLGANLGMQDAGALVQTVATARDGGKSIDGRGVLRRYERWRRGENAIAIRAMQGFKEVFGSELAPLRQLRAAGFQFADRVMPLKHALVQYAIGTRGDLPTVCHPRTGD